MLLIGEDDSFFEAVTNHSSWFILQMCY